MKYKKKYNCFFCVMLVIIVLSVSVTFIAPKLKDVASEKTDEIVEGENDFESSSPIDSTATKVEFYSFNTALRHAYAYLNTAKSYRTTTSGKFSLNVKNLVNIEQEVRISSEIDNLGNSTHSKLCTYGDGKIKNDVGFEFTKIGDQISSRKSKDVTNGVFSYENKEVTRYSIQDFMNAWKIMPQDALSKFSLNKVVGQGKLTKDRDEYTLVFTLEKGEITDNATFFIKKFFDNSKNAQAINPKFNKVTITMDLDRYGRPKKIKYDSSFYDLSLYGTGIPLSGLTGDVTYTQKFFDYGKDIKIDPMPDKV